MNRGRIPYCIASLVLASCATMVAAHAAMSPFGVATPDSQSGLADAGPLTGVLLWTMQMQAIFYRRLTDGLASFGHGPAAALWLIGLSFVYGIFHAVGPGHGKAVISSYLVATGDTRRRGVALSFAAGLVQALSAIVIVSVGTLIFNVTAVSMTRTTDNVEIASYALIAVLGLAMVVLKGRRAYRLLRPAPTGSTGFRCVEVPRGVNAGDGEPGAPRHGIDCACVTAIDLAGRHGKTTWKEQGAAVASIGIRPCSGALIVLVFAISQDLYLAGVLSVFAMAVGTGLTVSVVAIVSGTARNLLARFARPGGKWGARLSAVAQLAGAAFIFLLGVLLTTGALALDNIL